MTVNITVDLGTLSVSTTCLIDGKLYIICSSGDGTWIAPPGQVAVVDLTNGATYLALTTRQAIPIIANVVRA